MSDVLLQPSKPRVGRVQAAVISAVVSGAVIGAGAYYVGHQAGEDETNPASASLVRRQQADAVRRIVDSNRELIGIEQDSVALLEGSSGAEVDTVAFYRLRTKYTQTYDEVLAQMGRISILFDEAVRADAKSISHSAAVALATLYPLPKVLLDLSAAQVHAVVVNSHTARKGQWAALRQFSREATSQMLGVR